MAAPHSSADTPVMRQFLQIKGQYPDAVLMFRMGDFYELFFEDAVRVAPILDIALTSRDRDAEDPVPMAGVPYHAIGGYLRTLVERGLKVAICEQMETPEQAKRRRGAKIVRREVVRVVTPGALVDEEHLRSGEPNYLVAIAHETGLPGPCGLAALDISSGDFLVCEVDGAVDLLAELARLSPREILAPADVHEWLAQALAPVCPRLEIMEEAPLPAAVRSRVTTLAGEGVALAAPLAQAAGAALRYAEATQPGQTLLLHRIRRHDVAAHLVLDEASLRNLEIFRTLRDGELRGSLLWAMDGTKTAMGARLLRTWLGAPSRDRSEIRRRHAGIAALLAEPRIRSLLQSRLKDVRDVVRLASRARLGTISPRELGALRDSLAALPKLVETAQELAARSTDRALPAVLDLGEDDLADLHKRLQTTLVDEPPATARDGGIVRPGADAELDEQRRLRDGGREALAGIEMREREVTGITNLKVQHNRVFGYFIEVSRSHLGRVPEHYVRKQTLANAERFVTEELAGHESKVLGAQAEALVREQALFEALREEVSRAGERLCTVGERLAVVDVIAGLAELAERHGYVEPELVETPELEIEEGRHPVVERLVEAGTFVPNDVCLRAHGVAGQSGGGRLWLVTGPNMGGKSTVMRQTALITIMAHVGSYVPARRARVGLTDRVFTRVGAADDLGRGASTFMVEMRETAQILAHASAHSLVLLDEIGRGTATFDGLALAWAIAEFVHDQVGCRTMFATHYHELCDLEAQLVGLENVHVTVHEDRGRFVFLHRLASGRAGRSYGIQVGRLAGLPSAVIRRATRILERLEARGSSAPGNQLDLFAPKIDPETMDEAAAANKEPSSTASVGIDIAAELQRLDPDDLTPRQAHELVARWVAALRP